MSLSERIRPGVEAAPWVVDEVAKLEAERGRLLAAARTAAEQIRRCDYTPARSTLLQAIAAVDQPAAQPAPEPAIYSYSIDGEMFHGAFASPEAAAADGLLSNPDAPAIEVAECVRRPASAFVSGEFVVEDAQQRALDSCGDAAEDWLNDVVVDRAAMDELERHVGDWLQARDPATFFEVINARKITRAELIASGHLEADD